MYLGFNAAKGTSASKKTASKTTMPTNKTAKKYPTNFNIRFILK
jgi:hypothetical protein